jgi:hypothetical protein
MKNEESDELSKLKDKSQKYYRKIGLYRSVQAESFVGTRFAQELAWQAHQCSINKTQEKLDRTNERIIQIESKGLER